MSAAVAGVRWKERSSEKNLGSEWSTWDSQRYLQVLTYQKAIFKMLVNA